MEKKTLSTTLGFESRSFDCFLKNKIFSKTVQPNLTDKIFVMEGTKEVSKINFVDYKKITKNFK